MEKRRPRDENLNRLRNSHLYYRNFDGSVQKKRPNEETQLEVHDKELLCTSDHLVNYKKLMVTEISQDIITFPLFNSAFCMRMINEMKTCSQQKHSSIHFNMVGINLMSFGFSTFLDEIAQFITPVFSKYYSSHSSTFEVQGYHMYIVRYNVGDKDDVSHPPHRDDCDITLNVCLGTNSFKGGSLYFLDQMSKKKIASIKQIPGVAVMHKGSEIHGASKITEGERINLIMWFNINWTFSLFTQLPEGIHGIVMYQLNYKDLVNLSRCCKKLYTYSILNSKTLWKNVLSKWISKEELLEIENMKDVDWKSTFITKMGLLKASPLAHIARIAEELVDTEIKYSSSLSQFSIGLKETISRGLLKNNNEWLIKLSNIIIKLDKYHKELLKFALRWGNDYSLDNAAYFARDMCAVFTNMEKLFLDYNSQYEWFTTQLNKAKAKNKLFREYVEEKHTQFGLDFSCYMVMPVRRVPRYILLFQEIEKYEKQVIDQTNEYEVDVSIQVTELLKKMVKRMHDYMYLLSILKFPPEELVSREQLIYFNNVNFKKKQYILVSVSFWTDMILITRNKKLKLSLVLLKKVEWSSLNFIVNINIVQIHTGNEDFILLEFPEQEDIRRLLQVAEDQKKLSK